MLSGTKSFTVSTRADADSEPVQTVLTIDLNGCSEEVAVALAIQSAVIKWQGHARKHGIPERTAIKLAEFAPGKRFVSAPREMSAAEVAARAKVDAAYRAEVLAALAQE